jgi:hypothetical protein
METAKLYFMGTRLFEKIKNGIKNKYLGKPKLVLEKLGF